MVTINGQGLPVDMTNFTFDYFTRGTLSQQSSGSFRVTVGTQQDTFGGHDFQFDAAGVLIAGTMTHLQRIVGPDIALTINAFSISVQQFTDLTLADDSAGVMALITRDNDTINGSALNDHLLGGAGNDVIDGRSGNDIIDGGAGDRDLVNYFGATSAVSVNLSIAGPQSVGGGRGIDTLVGLEGIIGSAYNDLLIGNAEDNFFSPSVGTDLLDGGAGQDTVDYSRLSPSTGVTVNLTIAGAQTISGAEGLDTLISIENVVGTNFNDTLTGNDADNVLEGAGGNDQLSGGGGNDTFIGGTGVGNYDGGAGSDTVVLTAAPSGIGVDLNMVAQINTEAFVSIENVVGTEFADALTGNAEANTLRGEGGDDVVRGRGGNDVLDGGAGQDVASYSEAAGGVAVNLGLTGAQIVSASEGSDTLIDIETLLGSDFGDTLVGNDGANTLSGRGGADTLAGAGGIDVLRGEAGNDAIFGGLGLDDMYGGEGDDLLYLADNDGLIEGGAGFDQAIVLTTNGVNVTIETGIESVSGNNGNDTLSAATTTTAITIGGAGGNDVLTGGSGNDILAGMDGTDTVNGRVGNDQLFAGAGSDNFFGGDGDDLIYILGNDGTIDGGAGFDQAIVLDLAGVSISLGSGIEYAAGNAGNDTLNGSLLSSALTMGGAGGNDIVRGGSNGDTLSGAAGIDTLYGNAGADILFGGDDNDVLFGGTGNDQLFGGSGADVCMIETGSSVDSIGGFTNGLDKFDFTLHGSVTGFGSFVISAMGSDAIVDFTGGQLYIVGAAGQIDASDFIFA